MSLRLPHTSQEGGGEEGEGETCLSVLSEYVCVCVLVPFIFVLKIFGTFHETCIVLLERTKIF